VEQCISLKILIHFTFELSPPIFFHSCYVSGGWVNLVNPPAATTPWFEACCGLSVWPWRKCQPVSRATVFKGSNAIMVTKHSVPHTKTETLDLLYSVNRKI